MAVMFSLLKMRPVVGAPPISGVIHLYVYNIIFKKKHFRKIFFIFNIANAWLWREANKRGNLTHGTMFL